MPLMQVVYEVPDEIMAGLISGDLTRFGSVVRGSTAILAHLKEVEGPALQLPSGVGPKVLALVKSPAVAAIAAAGAVMAVGAGGVAYALQRRQRRIEALTSALAAYLEAVRQGRLDAEAVENVKNAALGLPRFGVRQQAFEPLVREVVAITRQFAELNAQQLPELEADVREGSLEQLRASLEAQARIIREAQ